jgi:hypothetical protein
MRARPFVAALLFVSAAAASAATPAVPVNIGDVPELDACVSWGVVTAAKLTVRGGPGTKYPAIDTVSGLQGLNLCDARGDWIGVVYSPGAGPADCGVAMKLPARQAYAGPCRSGWVHKAHVRVAVK